MKRPLTYLLTCTLALLWLVLSITGCNNQNVAQNDYKGNDIFSIYLLADRTTGEPPYDLDGFKLQDEPLLSIEDIEFYDFSTHCIYLKGDKSSLFPDEMPTARFYPFVVVANGERCYLGHFLSPVSSYAPMTPVIMTYPDIGLYPEDIIYIGNYSLDGSVDPRGDERIRNALLTSGKLNLGLSVALDDVKVISRGDTTTTSYTFTITNESDAALYVPDPDRMGIGLFHYYTSGVSLSNPAVYNIVLSTPYDPSIAPQPHDSWDVSWFTRVDSHESIKRTLTFDSDQIVSQDTYSCRFIYTGPVHIKKSDRMLSDGRLWMGEVESNAVEITAGN